MNFKLNTPLTEAFDELDKLSEEVNTADDPYGYGPYKTPDDPTLRVGDYIKAKQYAKDDKWYPGRVTEVTPDFVSYTISGWGFTKNGTALRSNRAKQAFGNLKKRLGEAMWENGIETYTDEKTENIVDELLDKADPCIIEYEGFDDEYTKDHWDYSSESHYQTSSTLHYSDFEYEIEVGDAWYDIVNILQKDLDKVIKSNKPSELLNTFIKLQKETEAASKDQATLYWNRLGVFVAENFDGLFEIFYSYLYDKYEELAYEWALDNVDPDWD
jgi:hypothetical protein